MVPIPRRGTPAPPGLGDASQCDPFVTSLRVTPGTVSEQRSPAGSDKSGKGQGRSAARRRLSTACLSPPPPAFKLNPPRSLNHFPPFLKMAERPPSSPRVVWEEVEAPQESSSPPEPHEVSMVQPLQMGETLPEEEPELTELQPGCDSESTSLLSWLDSSDMTKVFGKYLRPSQRTDILLVAIEALTSDDVQDRQKGIDVVYMAVRDPASWLADVLEIMRYIHKYVEHVRTEPARKSLDSLLLVLTDWSPRETVRSLLRISPTCDRAAMAMWEVLISVRWALWSVLLQLVDVLQDRRLRRVFSSATEDACIYPMILLLCTDIHEADFAALYETQRYLRRPSPVMLSLVLTGLVMLSKTPGTVSGGSARGATSAAGGWGGGGRLSPLHKQATVCFVQARKMSVLLPDILETLTDANADVKSKALVLFINVMGHMKREEADLISPKLVEKLLPLFDDECSRVRELSISLFRDIMKTAVGRNKKKMVKTVQSNLIPLYFHTSDQVESVAKASWDTLSACGDFLGWRRLSSAAETGQTHLIGDCLITHKRNSVDEYLRQSLPYVENPQATVREAAVRFIGLAVRRRSTLSQERVWQICNTLLPLRKDSELSVRALAAETVSSLTTEQSLTSRWSLRSLCCWLC
ncbi:uncharacterized protein LOC141972861 isoform X1 [Athene noctua]|uniref:uncharacterized protein LOC141972820 isoform X1 n=3 Tax=Athene noctua TaxID=126797 RepID=UPI003EC090F2